MVEAQNMLVERFDRALHTTMQSLGPQMFSKVGYELTKGQIFMLHFIEKEGHCSVSKLAERLEVNPSAITVMLDRLEHRNFVTRTRDQADRRVVNIQLTEAGTRELAQVVAMRRQILQACFDQIDATELQLFVNTLEKLAQISATLDVDSMLSTFTEQASSKSDEMQFNSDIEVE